MTGLAAPVESLVEVDDGISLHVRRWSGSSTPVLLVHGLASNARLWDGVAEVLARDGHDVVAVDLRGHGRSSKPDDGYDVARVAADLAALIAQLELDRPVVVGQSWGGNVVVELAAAEPSTVRAVMGVDGGTIDLQASFPDWETCAAALRPPPLAGRRFDDMERMVRDGHPDWPESGIQGTLACFERRADGTIAPWLTLERHLLVLRGLWEHRVADAYERLRVPALLLFADSAAARSRGGDPAARAAVTSRAPLPVAVEAMAGDHDLHAQHPEAVARVIDDFAASLPPAAEEG